MDDLSPTTRKFAAAGLAVITVLLICNLIVFPLRDGYSARQTEIAEARRKIGAYRQVLARAPALQQQAEQIRRDPQRRRGFLTAASPALAGARLEEELKRILQSNGGTMRSTRMQPQTGEGPERVRVTLDFTSEPHALLNIIHQVETAVPWLILDNVHVRTAHVAKSGSTLIKARMDVYAFVWRDAT